MDNFDELLKESLDEEAELDQQRKSDMRRRVVDRFNREVKKYERIILGCTFIFVMLVGMSWIRFLNAVTDKQQLHSIAAVAMGFGGLILMGLFSFLAHHRIGLLKELRLMRLGAQDDLSDPLIKPTRGDFSRKEIVVWSLVFLAVGGSILFGYSAIVQQKQRQSFSHREVVVSQSGADADVSESLYLHYQGRKSMMSLPMIAGDETGNGWIWADEEGEAYITMPSKSDGKKTLELQLRKPLKPGEWKTIQRQGELQATHQQDGSWKLELAPSATAEFIRARRVMQKTMIILPEELELLSVTPGPERQWEQSGKTMLRFVKEDRNQKPLKITIQYRTSSP